MASRKATKQRIDALLSKPSSASTNIFRTSDDITLEERIGMQPSIDEIKDTTTGNRYEKAQEQFVQACRILDSMDIQSPELDLEAARGVFNLIAEAYLTDVRGFNLDRNLCNTLLHLSHKMPLDEFDTNRSLLICRGLASHVIYQHSMQALMGRPDAAKEMKRLDLKTLMAVAVQDLKDAADLAADDPRGYKVLGQSLMVDGQLPEAVKMMEMALAVAEKLQADDPW